jgi:hypothetical protein
MAPRPSGMAAGSSCAGPLSPLSLRSNQSHTGISIGRCALLLIRGPHPAYTTGIGLAVSIMTRTCPCPRSPKSLARAVPWVGGCMAVPSHAGAT